MRCPVCELTGSHPFKTIQGSLYWRCGNCEATFLDAEQHPSHANELAEYRLHRNDMEDPGYRSFLGQLATPLLNCLTTPARGLDYGCGPAPLLAQMMRVAGHSMALYDPFFHPDTAALRARYDFITCTEVIEHFHAPADEFRRLDGLLKPGAWLGLMTCLQTDDARFANWAYRRDRTHVVFYRAETLRLLAVRHGWTCAFPCRNVALMHKR